MLTPAFMNPSHGWVLWRDRKEAACICSTHRGIKDHLASSPQSGRRLECAHPAALACHPCLPCRGCLGEDTLAWAEATAASLPRVPSAALIHIPIPEFLEVWSYYETNGAQGLDGPAVCHSTPWGCEVLMGLTDCLVWCWAHASLGSVLCPAAEENGGLLGAPAVCAGTKNENTACPAIQTGVFDTLK